MSSVNSLYEDHLSLIEELLMPDWETAVLQAIRIGIRASFVTVYVICNTWARWRRYKSGIKV